MLTKFNRAEFGLIWNKLVEGTAMIGEEVDITLQIEAGLAKQTRQQPYYAMLLILSSYSRNAGVLGGFGLQALDRNKDDSRQHENSRHGMNWTSPV